MYSNSVLDVSTFDLLFPNNFPFLLNPSIFNHGLRHDGIAQTWQRITGRRGARRHLSRKWDPLPVMKDVFIFIYIYIDINQRNKGDSGARWLNLRKIAEDIFSTIRTSKMSSTRFDFAAWTKIQLYKTGQCFGQCYFAFAFIYQSIYGAPSANRLQHAGMAHHPRKGIHGYCDIQEDMSKDLKNVTTQTLSFVPDHKGLTVSAWSWISRNRVSQNRQTRKAWGRSSGYF